MKLKEIRTFDQSRNQVDTQVHYAYISPVWNSMDNCIESQFKSPARLQISIYVTDRVWNRVFRHVNDHIRKITNET